MPSLPDLTRKIARRKTKAICFQEKKKRPPKVPVKFNLTWRLLANKVVNENSQVYTIGSNLLASGNLSKKYLYEFEMAKYSQNPSYQLKRRLEELKRQLVTVSRAFRKLQSAQRRNDSNFKDKFEGKEQELRVCNL